MTDPVDESSRRSVLLGGTTTLFLSLSLLLLGFFIILVSSSRYDSHRATPVLSGVARAFSDSRHHDGLVDQELFTGRHGRWLSSARSFEAALTRALTTDLRVLPVIHYVGADTLRALLPVESLFEPGKASFRSERQAFLDHLVAVLSSPPAGFSCEMSVLIQVSAMDRVGEVLLAEQRVVGFASLAAARGMPLSQLVVGEEIGKEGDLVLAFRLMPDGG
ncbi:hypothetical protein HEQ62_06735 [Haematospirillum jordaniae]|uniref:Motility protein B-like N-terminal domain-containing protein n=1 Tax=Haematospirillum jordaniae TaxID=1549855 RepID=A0A143DC18_9PROT|nr:hypothetical protein [Haematospirillum jordaniae]AMW33833.1 hypothetical protein AY555_00110 [Haematospirillum jordaniae]NKD44531.1 hypothetical protein [Haematospirillum jordaniae]NKD57551.1 hypothetical protein [Haematospirillum jordaniae]NKD59471.1 hypothetical protein [Haematospirillum jordaniae]NKD67466.1 hypothetical protein [Haematospirillum jordaniae]